MLGCGFHVFLELYVRLGWELKERDESVKSRNCEEHHRENCDDAEVVMCNDFHGGKFVERIDCHCQSRVENHVSVPRYKL